MGYTKVLKDIGLRLSRKRKEAGLTQEKLAEIIEVTPQTISYAEQGRKAMRPENIIKICKALSISADYLLMGKETEEISRLEKYFDKLTSEQQAYLQVILNACINLTDTNSEDKN